MGLYFSKPDDTGPGMIPFVELIPCHPGGVGPTEAPSTMSGDQCRERGIDQCSQTDFSSLLSKPLQMSLPEFLKIVNSFMQLELITAFQVQGELQIKLAEYLRICERGPPERHQTPPGAFRTHILESIQVDSSMPWILLDISLCEIVRICERSIDSASLPAFSVIQSGMLQISLREFFQIFASVTYLDLTTTEHFKSSWNQLQRSVDEYVFVCERLSRESCTMESQWRPFYDIGETVDWKSGTPMPNIRLSISLDRILKICDMLIEWKFSKAPSAMSSDQSPISETAPSTMSSDPSPISETASQVNGGDGNAGRKNGGDKNVGGGNGGDGYGPNDPLITALVFQGGGAKGVAYVGAIRILREKGILDRVEEKCVPAKEGDKSAKTIKETIPGQVTKFGGASVGAICAAFLALKCPKREMEDLMGKDFDKLLKGDKWYHRIPGFQCISGFISFFHHFGIYSDTSFHNWIGEEFENLVKKADKDKRKSIENGADITFKQVYELFGNQLCVVVCNVSTLTEEYYHPKTTPDFPVRKAVIMSMSLPVLLPPVVDKFCNRKDYYIDGGVICNFPIHCFDGWWLSMDEKDAFHTNLRKNDDSFEDLSGTLRTNRFKINPTEQSGTLGVRVVKVKEKQRDQRRSKRTTEEIPGTDLGRKYTKITSTMNEGLTLVPVIDELLKAWATDEENCVTTILDILMNPFREILKKGSVPVKYIPQQHLEEELIKDLKGTTEWGTNGDIRLDSEVGKKLQGALSSINLLQCLSKESELWKKLEKAENRLCPTGATGQKNWMTKILEILKNPFREIFKKVTDEEEKICFTFRDLESAIYDITKRPLAEWMTNHSRQEICGLRGFASGLQNLLGVALTPTDVYEEYVQTRRTITIETKYIDTTDFDMSEWDKDYLKKQGIKAAEHYFETRTPGLENV